MTLTIDRHKGASVYLSDSDAEEPSRKLLFVDDEVELLNLFAAVFMADNEVVTAQSAEQAIQILEKDTGFAVVVADLNMPGADGISFLSKVRTLAPDAVRIMLTGFGTRQAAISAVNDADVFKFLTKPIHVAPLRDAINAALAQHDKLCAERILLEQTVRGSVGVLVEVLSMAQPRIFGHAAERRQLVSRLCNLLKMHDRWMLEAAALLCNVGMLSLPDTLVDKLLKGEDLSRDESDLVHNQSDVAAELVGRVPRLEAVADSIALQHKNFDGTGYPQNRYEAGSNLPMGARILRLINEYLQLKAKGLSGMEAVKELNTHSEDFDKRLLVGLDIIANSVDRSSPARNVHVQHLRTNMSIAYDVYNDQGQLVVRSGQNVTTFLAEHLKSFHVSGQIPGIIAVRDSPGEGAH